jgi:hypothetical protein
MSAAFIESLDLNFSGQTIYSVDLTGIGHLAVP